MRAFIKIVLVVIVLLPDLVFAYGQRAGHVHRDDHYRSEFYYRNLQGWDMDPRQASAAANCYYYTLYVEGGRGSARIMSLPGKNYIQFTSGLKEGYVCFNGPTTLELGKLSNPNVYVELDIEDIGIFYFDPGDNGSRFVNNWYRSYQELY